MSNVSSVTEDAERHERRPVHWVDLIFPVLGTGFALYYVSTIWDLPREARMSGILLSGLILLFSGLFVARFIKQARHAGIRSGITAILGTGALLWRRLGLMALIIVYVLVSPLLGFTLSIFAFLLASFAFLGERSLKRLLLTSVVMALVGYLLFMVVLKARLPEGPVEHLFDGLLQLLGGGA